MWRLVCKEIPRNAALAFDAMAYAMAPAVPAMTPAVTQVVVGFSPTQRAIRRSTCRSEG